MTIQNRKLRLFLSSKSAVAGLITIFIMIIIAMFPGLFAAGPYGDKPAIKAAVKQSLEEISPNSAPQQKDVAAVRAPSWDYWMGLDSNENDIYSQIIYGTRISVLVGFIAVSISLFFGVLLGGLAGFMGGWTDAFIMRAVDVLLSFPSILLALFIMAIMGDGLFNVMIAVGISGLPRFARQMRAEVLTLRELDYVIASRALGANGFRVFFRHILPNSLGPLTVLASLGMASAVLEAAGLGFLGLGAGSNDPEWGYMLKDNRNDITLYPWTVVFPGVAIAITVLSFNLVGDGIRDAFDPTTTKR
ncbi:MAG: ABC transporter permease [Planctomycetota bacterium]|nr:ABC transporter permease [Planctomycetota bacterium]